MSDTGIGGRLSTVVVRYEVRPERQAEFLDLLAQHWTTLWYAGLVTEETAQCYAGVELPDRPSTVFEIFTWVSPQAAATAHAYAEVAELWRRMGELCEGDRRPVSTAVQLLELAND